MGREKSPTCITMTAPTTKSHFPMKVWSSKTHPRNACNVSLNILHLHSNITLSHFPSSQCFFPSLPTPIVLAVYYFLTLINPWLAWHCSRGLFVHPGIPSYDDTKTLLLLGNIINTCYPKSYWQRLQPRVFSQRGTCNVCNQVLHCVQELV